MNVEVIQADRDVAADFWRDNHNVSPSARLRIREGERDESPLVQAFARHRLSTSPDRRVRELVNSVLRVVLAEDKHSKGTDRSTRDAVDWAYADLISGWPPAKIRALKRSLTTTEGSDEARMEGPPVYHLGAALQGIADEHADVLSPRQTAALYAAAAKLWDDLSTTVRENGDG